MTPRPLRALAGVTSTLALVAGGIAATSVAAHAAEPNVDETSCPGTPIWTGPLTDGQEVSGLTTVEGDTLDTFQGTYQGTITDPYGNDIYLFDLSGSRITGGFRGQGPAGIWAGISGSPVYDADDNLVGSVSYSFTGNEGSTLAGITPAINIINADPTATPAATEFKISSSDKADLRRAGVASASSLRSAKQLVPQHVVVGSTAERANDQADKSRVLARHSDRGTYGSAGRADLLADPIQPGGNIASSYSYGQIAYASVGTVTAVCDGDQVYAYGHPDENTGTSTQTILKAETLSIVSDGPESYKMVNIDTEPAGSLTSDNINGIHGTIGTTPDTAEVVTHTTANGQAPVTRTSQVSTQYALSTIVATQVGSDAYNAFKKNGAGDAVSTVEIDYVRDVDGVPTPGTFERTDRLSASSYFPDEVSYAAADDVETLLSNGFEDVTITKVEVTSTLLPDYRSYKVAGAQYLKGSTWKNVPSSGIPTKAGAKVTVRAKLAKSLGSTVSPTVTEPITWQTSSSTKKSGSFSFFGQASSFEDEEFFADESDIDEGDSGDDEGPQIESFDQLVDYLESLPRQDDVLVRYRYSTKSGKLQKFRTARAPGVVTGSLTVRLNY